MEENIMKLKKLTALTLALSLALSLTACGGGNDSTSGGGASNSSSGGSNGGASTATTTEIVDDTTGLKIPCEPIELSMGCSGTVEGTIAIQ